MTTPLDELVTALAGAARTLPKGEIERARVELLVSAARNLPPEEVAPLWAEVYRVGDNGEKRAVLRALQHGPALDGIVEIGVAACRTNVRDVFEAIACDNPFPAARFPEANFNQMVLKALFVGLPLARVEGLDGRLNPDLSRMAQDYASERRAAGRSVPEDIQKVI